MKTRYYVNSLTSAGIDLTKTENAVAGVIQSTQELPEVAGDDYCESCAL